MVNAPRVGTSSLGLRADNWLLFLGAGASVGKPTHLPAFPQLAAGVLQGIGWSPAPDDGSWTHSLYPAFRAPDMAPEVLFGTLSLFNISFARDVADLLCRAAPNALHYAAAAVVGRGGLVWTTNMDCAVESARGVPLARAGRASHLAPHLLAPLQTAGPGVLIKFHGTAEAPETLAFTDRELLVPLPDDDVEHLAGISENRRVVFYGYAGADADLYDLLEQVFHHARDVVWFEPSLDRRDQITQTFPNAQIRFEPNDLCEGDFAEAIRCTASAFVEFARKAGIDFNNELTATLVNTRDLPRPPTLRLRQPPGVTHARLVERFGAPGDDLVALHTARWHDVRKLRIDAVAGHVRWAINISLYRGGIVARAVDWLANNRSALRTLRPIRLRHYVITRACALRLQRRDLPALEAFATWAIEHRRGRPNPSDLYYRAQARRYGLLTEMGKDDADRAATGLSIARDPERRAGAVLEQGCLAIYQGRFDTALRAAFELRYRTGRYAIPRWQAWGAWLEAIAHCHLQRPEEGRSALEAAAERFSAEQRPGPIADIRTAHLFAARVYMALGNPTTYEPEMADAEELGGRYLDDRSLVLADLALAGSDTDEAERLLNSVKQRPSCAAAQAWANIGLAEIDRLIGRPDAADAFAATAERCAKRGAYWLQLQALLGLNLCGDLRAEIGWRSLPGYLRDGYHCVGLGRPRVLWMMVA